MKTDQFDYILPDGFIAQYPPEKRERARLLVLDRKRGVTGHTHFDHVVDYIDPGDVLVLNQTKVIPARIFGTRADTGGKMEILLLREMERDVWEALTNPAKKAKEGARIVFDSHGSCEVTGVLDTGKRILKFDSDARALMDSMGTVPLPPYIKREPEEIDKERYQTVFALEDGSVAAPTAGLHFTEEILSSIAEKAEVVFITLHVGMGTFKPIKTEDISEHEMEVEYYEIPQDSADRINRAKGKVIAVGTTVVRSLESAGSSGEVKAGSGETSLYIYPPYDFRIVDRMITNFHLPKATTFVLTAAFAGLDRLKAAYMEAIGKGYRFYSYGDAMIIL
jgi:S-adenosylmethionine:tRNA ribosyltransferase-isomerase